MGLLKNKKVLIALGAVLIVAGAVASMSGIGGKKGPEPKLPIEPIPMSEPFVVNLADTDATHYAKVGIAVELAPMPASEHALFVGGGGGHGGGESGADKVAVYTPFRDAVIRTISGFTSEELLRPQGKDDLKVALRAEFAKVYTHDKEMAKHDEHHAPTSPPYEVSEIYFTDFAVQ